MSILYDLNDFRSSIKQLFMSLHDELEQGLDPVDAFHRFLWFIESQGIMHFDERSYEMLKKEFEKTHVNNEIRFNHIWDILDAIFTHYIYCNHK